MKRSTGNTPLINFDGLYIKLEHLNPSGSIKDRIAEYITDKAEKSGQLKKGYTIIEATSGNTGIAFSRMAALRGYKMIAVMPKGMSPERTKFIKAYGAKILNTKLDDFTGAIKKAAQLCKKPRTFGPKQFENPLNTEEHEKFLGKEILEQMKGKTIHALVAGVGSGGTLIGVGKALRKKFPKIKIYGVEPDECHLLASSGIRSVYYANKKTPGASTCKHHEIQGIADGIIPEIIKRDKKMIDGMISIKSKEALETCKKLARRGYFVGPSSGANYIGAKFIKKLHSNWNIITFFCDRGDRYLSEGIYQE